MASARTCPECGAAIPDGSLQGFCSQCLFGFGLEAGSQQVKEDGSGASAAEPDLSTSPEAPARAPAKPQIPSAPFPDVSPLTERAGDRIGRYKLLQQIGEGGFGVVYMAQQQEPVKRRVALKIIKLGMDTKAVVARFEAERQALALMDHPNIAKILDAGSTATGRPYFVMELVSGIRITDYCNQHRVPTRQRLDLFVQICRAVQHAHQKGIIHRDLKPSNILVTLHDGVPMPKVIDFGIAKATQAELTEKTLFTQFQQFVGTPAYMSPEQAEFSALDIDTRSDIYSLGVLLYELLTGKTPFETKDLLAAGVDEMRRTILEEEPVRPSTRLSGMAAEELTSAARQRQLEPVKLLKLIRGDLDWIVMRCLEKDRTRRYETANGLAMDIIRYQHDEPVIAAAPGLAYRVQKFVRRHRVAVTAGGVVLVVFACGIAGTTWGLVQALRQKREATRQAATARQMTDFLMGMFEKVDPDTAKVRDITVLELLDEATSTIFAALSNQPLVEIHIRQQSGAVYRRLGRADQALAQAEAALGAARLVYGRKDQPEVANSLGLVAACLWDLGRSLEALPKFEETLAMRQRLYRGDHEEVADGLNNLASCLSNLGRKDQALLKYMAALEMRQRLFQGDREEVANSLNNVAICLYDLGRLDEALPKCEAALEMRQRLYKGDDASLAASLNTLGGCLYDLGRMQEALENHGAALAMRQRIFKGDHPSVAVSMNNVARCLEELGRSAEALTNHEAALEMRQRIYKKDHPGVATSLNNVGMCLSDLGRSAEALPKCQAALEMRQRIYKGDHPSVARSLSNVGQCLSELDKPNDALTNYQAALAMGQRVYKGADHPEVAAYLDNLGSCLASLDRSAEALPKLQAALEMRRRIYHGDRVESAKSLRNVASCLGKLGKPDEGLSLCENSVAMLERLSAAEPTNFSLRPELAEAYEKTGDLLAQKGAAEQAKQKYLSSLRLADAVLKEEATNQQAAKVQKSCRLKLGSNGNH